MTRRVNKLALLAGIETVEGTDAVPTAAANAILATNVKFTPIEGEEVSRDLLLPYLGNQGIVLAGTYRRIEFDVEIAGAGAAGDAPAYGPLLRGCGLSETISAGVDVVYEPVSAGFESVSMYYNLDGVRAVLLGGRGTVSAQFSPQKIPKLSFNFIGLDGTFTDAALPATDFSGFVDPIVVSKANTTFSLHGYSGPTEDVSIDLGNDLYARLLINAENCLIADRQAKGQAVMEAAALATINWDAIAKAGTKAALQLVHGTIAGNIVQVDAPKVQIGRWTESQTQKIANNTLPLMLIPNSGNDELVITVK